VKEINDILRQARARLAEAGFHLLLFGGRFRLVSDRLRQRPGLS